MPPAGNAITGVPHISHAEATIEAAEEPEGRGERTGIRDESTAPGDPAVVDDRPVATACFSNRLHPAADCRVMQTLRAEPPRFRHVRGVDGPHVGLHFWQLR